MSSRPTLLDLSYFPQLPKYQDFWSIGGQIKGIVFRWCYFHRKIDGKDTTGILLYSAIQLVLFHNCAFVICLTSHRNVTQLNYFLCACISIYRQDRALTDCRAQSVGTSSWLAPCRLEWGGYQISWKWVIGLFAVFWVCCWHTLCHNYWHKESEAWKYLRRIASVKVHRKSLSFICNEVECQMWKCRLCCKR